jgi:hypothetical protein
MGKKFILDVVCLQVLLCTVSLFSWGLNTYGQTTKQDLAEPDEEKKGVQNLAKPFTHLSFDKVRVMAVTPEVAPEKPVEKAANAGQQGQQAHVQAAASNSSGSNFSFGMYLAPPSSSFGALVKSMQEQVELKKGTRDADARQTDMDRLLGFARINPVHLGPVNLGVSLGAGSVQADALDDFNDRLLEKPQFVKPKEPMPSPEISSALMNFPR